MTLQEKTTQKIKTMSPAWEQMPAVVIIHNLTPSTVIHMNSNGIRHLRTTLKELQDMGTDYYEHFFNPEDAADYVPKVLGMLERNNDDETITFFQQVRPSPSDDWQWYACGTRIFMRDDQGSPFLTITNAVPIDSKHYFTNKIDRLLEENEFLRRNQQVFATLTRREKEILALMARDQTSNDIAGSLHLSDHTVKTHRRNIKKKISAQNQYDVVRFAQSFNLV